MQTYYILISCSNIMTKINEVPINLKTSQIFHLSFLGLRTWIVYIYWMDDSTQNGVDKFRKLDFDYYCWTERKINYVISSILELFLLMYSLHWLLQESLLTWHKHLHVLSNSVNNDVVVVVFATAVLSKERTMSGIHNTFCIQVTNVEKNRYQTKRGTLC